MMASSNNECQDDYYGSKMSSIQRYYHGTDAMTAKIFIMVERRR
jgi:hypothetical protein